MKRKPGRMGGLGKKTVDRTNEELSDEELDVLLASSIDWKKLRPDMTDHEAYDKLVETVRQATQKNENVAQLRKRLVDLGTEVMNLASKVIRMV